MAQQEQPPVFNPSETLAEMSMKIDELPLLPQVLIRILQLDSDSEDYFDEFEQLVQEDPAFAVRVIALANSAAHAPADPVVAIRSALSRLGCNTIRSLIASLAVHRVFMPTEANQIQLWVHSIRTAVASRAMARLIPHLGVDSEQAYLAGLLHDIGRFVMFEHAPQRLLEVDESKWHTPEDIAQADIEAFSYTHSELGYLACRKWGLPDEITKVVRVHHNNVAGSVTPRSTEALVSCVQLADRLCIAILEQPEYESYSNDVLEKQVAENCLKSATERSWLTPNDLVKHIQDIVTESDEILEGIGFVVLS